MAITKFQENFEHSLNTIGGRLELKGIDTYHSYNDNLIVQFYDQKYYNYSSILYFDSKENDNQKVLTIDLNSKKQLLELFSQSIKQGFIIDDNVVMIKMINYDSYSPEAESCFDKILEFTTGKVFVIQY